MASIDRCSVSVVCCCCRKTERSTVALERSSTSTVSSADCVIDAAVDSSATAVCHSATAMADEQPRKMFFSLSSCVSSMKLSEIGMGEQEGGLYYFKEPEKKMVCSAKKESASLDTGSKNEVSSYDEDEETRTEEQMDRSRRDGGPEESGRADRLQTVDLMDRSDVHGRPSERQNDGFLRDDQTVDLVDRSDIHGRPSARQNDVSLGDDQTVDCDMEDGRPSPRSPQPNEANDPLVAMVNQAWYHNNYLAINIILEGLGDSLYPVYAGAKLAKELWNSLNKKYQAEDAGTKKFIVGKMLDYKMVGSKSVVAQAEELTVIFNKCNKEKVGVSEAFQVADIIHKLPRSWEDFQADLKLKRTELNPEQLLTRLRIREEGLARRSGRAKANVVEHPSGSSHGGKDKKKMGPKGGVSKFVGKCYNCGITGHRSSDCRKKKPQKGKKKTTEAMCAELDNLDLCAVVTEVNLVSSSKRSHTEMMDNDDPNQLNSDDDDEVEHETGLRRSTRMRTEKMFGF
ncbi:unnamed protein product [Cuscuta campestris]|uniref:CCHC-type domain-containing protein n=1 Tax=Cuscuta campestris TaxID=132261 RepID=A0A484LS68_9ASTE|nr:unnamed protein product [Cuscuta campestris]